MKLRLRIPSCVEEFFPAEPGIALIEMMALGIR
jgi:hypothetical protein